MNPRVAFLDAIPATGHEHVASAPSPQCRQMSGQADKAIVKSGRSNIFGSRN
jgi:hypothetical protein